MNLRRRSPVRPIIVVAILSARLFTAVPAAASQDIDVAAHINRPKVKAYVRRFVAEDMRGWLASTVERGLFFAPYISRIIDDFELPASLIYLPVVESEYNPRAVSSSGAAGLWQFMMNSIDGYDLTVDEWIDERKDFWKATPASLRKLQYNYQVLGDWFLAIAAYNCGLGRMQRAIEESGERDYWALAEGGFLPKETVNYIPKFLAVVHIAKNADFFGLEIPPFPTWHWHRIPVNGQINVRLLADRANIPPGLLTFANAELRYDVTPPERPYHLKVPDIYSDVIKRTLEGDVLALNRFYVHTISRGDTLYGLARHFGVSVDLIKYHNPGIQPRFLQINSQLLIPVIRETPPPPQPEAPPARIRRRAAMTRYEVQAGDTLWDIARRFKLSIDELVQANTLSTSHHILPGQVLNIPVIGNEMMVQ